MLANSSTPVCGERCTRLQSFGEEHNFASGDRHRMKEAQRSDSAMPPCEWVAWNLCMKYTVCCLCPLSRWRVRLLRRREDVAGNRRRKLVFLVYAYDGQHFQSKIQSVSSEFTAGITSLPCAGNLAPAVTLYQVSIALEGPLLLAWIVRSVDNQHSALLKSKSAGCRRTSPVITFSMLFK